MKRVNRTWVTMAVGLLVATTLFGCAQDVGTIDRTQHNIIKKSDLLNKEFYFRATVIEAPFSSAYTTVGDQGRLERGVFEIQEANLHFFRTYEWVQGGDDNAAKSDTDTPLLDDEGNPVMREVCLNAGNEILGPPEICADPAVDGEVAEVPVYVYRGAPLASFPIDSHFDIERTYNPATGEKTNVIVENTSDRMWYERDYMRVDWSTPQIKNFSLLMLGLSYIFPNGKMEENLPGIDNEFSVYKGEADEPRYQPRFVDMHPEDEVEEFHYIDVVSHWVMGAGSFINDDGDLTPACYYYPFYVGGIYGCTSEQISVRFAFLDVDQAAGYASKDYDDTQLEKFGYYRAERQFYDRIYDRTYTAAIRKAFLHPIWEAGRDADGNLIPEELREPKPIVYYLSEGYPRELVDETLAMAGEWSAPFEDVIKYYKQGESPTMFVICENDDATAAAALEQGLPVAGHTVANAPGYNALCRDMDLPKYNGDLRYNQIHAITAPQMNGLLGFGPPAADPLTGQIINANAYMYVAEMRRSLNRVFDVIESMAGLKNLSDYMWPAYITQDVKAQALEVESNDLQLTEEEAIALARTIVDPQVEAVMLTRGVSKTDVDWPQARLNIIRNDRELERMMVDDAIRLAFRDPYLDSNRTPSDEAISRMSLRNWAHYEGFKERLKFKLITAEMGADFVEFSDPAIYNVARAYALRYDEAVCSTFAGEGYADVLDYDAFGDVKLDPNTADGTCTPLGDVNSDGYECQYVENAGGAGFAGQYWVNVCTAGKLVDQLRERIREEEGTDPYTYWPPSGLYTDSHNPRINQVQQEMKDLVMALRDEFIAEAGEIWYQAITAHEVGHSIGLRHNFAATTDALNYPKEYWYLKGTFRDGEFEAYNRYGHETRSQMLNGIRQLQNSSVMDYGAKFNSEWEGVGNYDRAAIRYGYGGLVEYFDNPVDLSAYEGYLRNPSVDTANSGVRYETGDKMEDIFRVAHYTNLPNLFGADDTAIDRMYERSFARAEDVPETAQEVPYRFCEYDRTYYDPYCAPRDSGADPYEIVANAFQDYEEFDWWTYGYSHNSELFWIDSYMDRVRSTFYKARMHYQWWALNYIHFNKDNWWANGPGRGAGPDGEDLAWHEDPNGGLMGTLAAFESYNRIASAFGRPVPGYFGYNARSGYYENVTDTGGEVLTHQFRIQEDQGARPMYPAWDYNAYLSYPVRSGALYDRLAAFEALTDPRTDFLGIDEEADTERYLVSFYDFFPAETLNLLGGVLTGRVEGFGWCVQRDERQRPTGLIPRDYLLGAECDAARSQVPLHPESKDYTFPTTKFRIPVLAAYYGMSLLVSNYDRSFMDVTRIFLSGHENAIDFDSGTEVAEYEDPLTGRIYVAGKVGYADEFEPAYFLVNEANRLLEEYIDPDTGELDLERLVQRYPQSQLEATVGLLELVRSMHSLYDYNGASSYGADPFGNGY